MLLSINIARYSNIMNETLQWCVVHICYCALGKGITLLFDGASGGCTQFLLERAATVRGPPFSKWQGKTAHSTGKR